jgi:D-alanine-D-alanine ligase
MTHSNLLTIAEADKARLKVLFLAKHACASGQLDEKDGNHAVYHHELLTTMQSIGLNVTPANDFSALYDKTGYDFVFTMLNRAGFPMSEMLGPLLATRIDLPFSGASPIIRGLSDDKHLMKALAEKAGIPVTRWAVYRRGGLRIDPPEWDSRKLVVKPNASSASWGVGMFDNWPEAKAHVAKLHAERHDVIVEDYFGDHDIVVPVVGHDTPWILPTCRFVMDGSDDQFRSYEEKRGLTEAPKERLVQINDPAQQSATSAAVRQLLPELWPFDFGRFEFRYDEASGQIRFMEVNLSCNLWSKKTISWAVQQQGYSHQQLLEHIIAYSMERQGVIDAVRR